MFLRNAWYTAAWDHEVGRALLPRTICDDRPLVKLNIDAGGVRARRMIARRIATESARLSLAAE